MIGEWMKCRIKNILLEIIQGNKKERKLGRVKVEAYEVITSEYHNSVQEQTEMPVVTPLQ